LQLIDFSSIKLSSYVFKIKYKYVYILQDKTNKFYMSCYQMVEMYARYNINRVSLDVDAEDQCYQDLYIFLELLTHIMSKEFLHLSTDGKKQNYCFNFDYVILT